MSDQVNDHEDDNVELDDVDIESFDSEFDEDDGNFGLEVPLDEDDDSY